jgi:hypothetical protein
MHSWQRLAFPWRDDSGFTYAGVSKFETLRVGSIRVGFVVLSQQIIQLAAIDMVTGVLGIQSEGFVDIYQCFAPLALLSVDATA